MSSPYRGHFWQITHANNLTKIIKDGYLGSRSFNLSIPYDNICKNDTTKSVMSTNATSRIEKYVRLYVNPRNKAFFKFKDNMGEDMVFIAFNQKAVLLSRQPVLFFIGLGHNATMDKFSWKDYAINLRDKFVIPNFNAKNLANIYSTYDKYSSDEIKGVPWYNEIAKKCIITSTLFN